MRFQGSKLKQFREQAGLTQDELAELVGCSTHSISCYEWGYRDPRAGTLMRLAEVLERPPAAFFIKTNDRAADPVPAA